MQTIAEIMSRDITSIAPDQDLQKAAQLMRDLDVGALPVCEGRQLKGIVADRDITIRATARGIAPSGCRVADITSKEASWCFGDQSVGSTLEDISRPTPPQPQPTSKRPGTH